MASKRVIIKATIGWRGVVGATLLWVACSASVSLVGESKARIAMYSAVYVIGLGGLFIAGIVWRVELDDEKIVLRSWRTRSVARAMIERVEIRQSFMGRRVVLICKGEGVIKLPVPWRSDPNWSDIVQQIESWQMS
ncbi:hypothetical protein GCM10023195_61550 [Actinoallomurus liliacearum]|uniref:PH domain-containing protein n=2 Tax=Actinoallomurus liliacearum TaxID=1080073 RepID=A0ABP8TSQ7_9ACTN